MVSIKGIQNFSETVDNGENITKNIVRIESTRTNKTSNGFLESADGGHFIGYMMSKNNYIFKKKLMKIDVNLPVFPAIFMCV